MDSPLGATCGKCGRQKGSLCRCRACHLTLVPPPKAHLTFGMLTPEQRGEEGSEPFRGDDAA